MVREPRQKVYCSISMYRYIEREKKLDEVWEEDAGGAISPQFIHPQDVGSEGITNLPVFVRLGMSR